jgi:DEAD/DEAH box helicase domain-containing protein
VCCSATIGNPGELASMLTGRPARLVDRNGAPSGERHVLLVDPPVMEPASGARASAVTLAQRWALPFLRAGRQTIVFGRSRTAVEILLTGLRESLRESYGPRSRVRGYRGGYLPTERRAIERGLRDGEVLGVVSTNALELGVDIGRLDAAILAGYPGSVAATWQQFGRAGRRLETSVAVLVASGAPVDQFVIHHPEFLLDNAPEEARLDPDNLHILLAHLRAATFELPFDPGEVFGPGPADDLLAFLAEERHVRQADDGRWYWSSENFPASEISLRTAAPENVVIIDTTPDRPRVLGEVDLFSAQVLVHERAIYIHESVQYYVDRLEWGERKAYVHRVDVDHYTYANRAVTLKPLEVFAEARATGGRRIHGEVMVASLVTLFKKLKFLTDENVGWGPIDLPELELQTTAYWLTADHTRGTWRRDDLDIALMGAGRAIQTVAAILLMGDPRDLGLVTQVRSPHAEVPTIYLYEAVPGGIGLSERLWQRHAELVTGAAALIAGCPCEGGCPACTGPRSEPGIDAKQLARRLLAELGADPIAAVA